MSITPFQALACPLDGLPLHCHGSAWRCDSGHSFDIASHGLYKFIAGAKQTSRDRATARRWSRRGGVFSRRLLPADCRCGEPGRAGRSAG